MRQGLCVLMILAACGKGSGGDGKGSDDCAAAVAHMTSLQAASLPKQLPEAQKKQLEAMVAKMNGAIAASCRETRWSKEVLACIKGLKAVEDGKQCDEKLTPEQRAAVEKAAKQVQQEAEQDLQEVQKRS